MQSASDVFKVLEGTVWQNGGQLDFKVSVRYMLLCMTSGEGGKQMLNTVLLLENASDGRIAGMTV